MKKLFLSLAVIAVIIPCAVVFAACGNVFAKNDNSGNDTPDTPTPPPVVECDEPHADDVMYKAENLNISGTVGYDNENGGTTYHNFALPSQVINGLRVGNVILVDFTVELGGVERAHSVVSKITSNGIASVSSMQYVNENKVVSSGGMLGSVHVQLRNGTGAAGSRFYYSGTLNYQTFSGMKITLKNVTIYGDVS